MINKIENLLLNQASNYNNIKQVQIKKNFNKNLQITKENLKIDKEIEKEILKKFYYKIIDDMMVKNEDFMQSIILKDEFVKILQNGI